MIKSERELLEIVKSNPEKLKEEGISIEQIKDLLINNEDLYNLVYDYYFFQALAESEEDIKNGRVMTIEESKERMKKKYENFDIR